MFQRGKYLLKVIYNKGVKEIVICNTSKTKDYHTHIPFSKFKAARMIVVRANQGYIPSDYPRWMIKSINRLWYGKNCSEDFKMVNDCDIEKHKNQKPKTIKRRRL